MVEKDKAAIEKCFNEHGLVGLVNIIGLNPKYFELIGLLDYLGVQHNLDKVHNRGLGLIIDDVLLMACKGLNAKQVAEEVGYENHKSIYRFCLRHGIRLKQPVMLKDLSDEVRQMAKSMTAPEIARELGFRNSSVYRLCKKLGIKPVRKDAGVIYTHNGYRMLLKPQHPNADSKGYVREHRLVAEAKIGRLLTEDEVVHHINGDKLDNSPENLEVMTKAEHTSLHATEGETGWAYYHASKI